MPRAVEHAPDELTGDRLKRIGEGIGKVVYASDHWVVHRERSPREIIALILLWKILRRFPWGRRMRGRSSGLIRLMRAMIQSAIAIVPKRLWYTKHVEEVLTTHRRRDRTGEKLARLHLADTELIPATITFPPITVLIGGWPGWLVVDKATERVETTLDRLIDTLAAAGDFESVDHWLHRLLDTRQIGWQLGLFSVDAHLKNFGVIGDRIVLIDTGGLTDRWEEIDRKLSLDIRDIEPHVQLGLDKALATQPEIARRFNVRWRSLVNRESIREHWPEPPITTPVR